MSTSTQRSQDLALWLLGEEAGAGGSAVARVCGKLGALLIKLAGSEGFRSLLSRALSLAQGEVSWLGTVKVLPDGRLEGLEEAKAITDKDELARGEVVITVHLLDLLFTFIGEPLTMQLVKEAWPALQSRSSLDSPKS